MAKSNYVRSMMFFKPSPLPFIPPFEEATRLLGVPANLSGAVSYFARKYQVDLPVSDKTLRTASRGPVTRRTAQKIGNFMLSKLPYQIDQNEVVRLYEPWESLGALNNGCSWQAGVLYPIRKSKIDINNNFIRFLSFIENRSNQELEILRKLKSLEGKKTPRQKLETIWYEFLSATTLISEADLEEGVPALVQWCIGSNLQGSALLKLNRLFLKLTVDFYYSAIACLDYDLSCPLRQAEGADQRLWDVGLFGDLVPKGSTTNFREPVEVLLDEWRGVFAKSPRAQLTWAEMHRKLPYPHGIPPKDRTDFACEEDARKEIDEVRKGRLYAWRRGKRPTKEQIDVFVRNLVPADYDDWWACLRFYWANALGQLIESVKVSNESALSKTEVVAAFECYRRYWASFGAPAAPMKS
ncbi:hypothetical protein [Marinobacter adhaerens]|jgi:hypothetical protein|uniref:hypothetical protein n=1 Tax=Marinobacter adhaerens TaxID=1033846 RepID=UPI003BA8E22B